MRRISLAIFIIFSVFVANAQRVKLSGKVTNNKNEALIAVTVTLKSDKTQTTKTDVEGRYSFNLDINKSYIIGFNYIGYKEKSINVKATSSEEFIADILLEESGKKLTDVVVSATRSSNKGATDNALIAYQRNTNTVSSVISAESIRRSPDRNTAEILKRTPGASI